MKKIFLITFLFFEIIFSRESSEPFISGDTFRKYANFIVDRKYHPVHFPNQNMRRFDPRLVQKGDIIFVDLACMGEFFTNIHPNIKSKYILITHNHDYSAPGKYIKYLLDEKIVVWFTQNSDIADHPKIVPIPIGLQNKHWQESRTNDIKLKLMQEKLKDDVKKKYLLYGNFAINTNYGVRNYVHSLFKTKSFYFSVPKKKSYEEYLLDLAHSKFVLSPQGVGLDCIRTWETLYMGSYPVVKTSTLDSLYKNLPVLIVKNWEDITKEFLEAKYQEMKNKEYNLDKLYFSYWLDLIYFYKKQIRSIN